MRPNTHRNHFMKFSLRRTALALSLGLALAFSRHAAALTINFVYPPDAVFLNAGLSQQDIADMKAANTFAPTIMTDRYTDNINVNFKVSASPGTSDLASSSTEI